MADREFVKRPCPIYPPYFLKALVDRTGCVHKPSAPELTQVLTIKDNAINDNKSENARPEITIGEVAWLKIAEVNHLGAFADWGLSKDLFIPFGEQQHPLKAGAHAVVKVYLDNQVDQQALRALIAGLRTPPRRSPLAKK